MTTTETLLARIEEHCRRHRLAESTFGRKAVNDGKLVARLRSGKSITLDTLDRIEAELLTDYEASPDVPYSADRASPQSSAPAEPGPASNSGSGPANSDGGGTSSTTSSAFSSDRDAAA